MRFLREGTLKVCHPERSKMPTKWASCRVEGPLITFNLRRSRQAFSPRPVVSYASTKNFPSRMICSSSTQMLNFRPTTSICVDESHSAPVWAP